jgi:hypothetical protein
MLITIETDIEDSIQTFARATAQSDTELALSSRRSIARQIVREDKGMAGTLISYIVS